jgi:hypothetical protein
MLQGFPDRRAIPLQSTRDLGLAELLLMHARNDAAFVKTKLYKGAGHSIPVEPWPLLSSLHLKMESAHMLYHIA